MLVLTRDPTVPKRVYTNYCVAKKETGLTSRPWQLKCAAMQAVYKVTWVHKKGKQRAWIDGTANMGTYAVGS